MQSRREKPNREQQADADAERDEDQRDPVSDLLDNGPTPEEHVARALAVRVEKEHDERDEHEGVDERQPGHVCDLQLARGTEGREAECGERRAESDLRREIGADEYFDEATSLAVAVGRGGSSSESGG